MNALLRFTLLSPSTLRHPLTLTPLPPFYFPLPTPLLSLTHIYFSISLSFFSHSLQQNVKVAVLGAAGGIGQPLSLLLKDVDAITHLSLFDLVNTPGVAADLSHINTKAKVRKWSEVIHACVYLCGITKHRADLLVHTFFDIFSY